MSTVPLNEREINLLKDIRERELSADPKRPLKSYQGLSTLKEEGFVEGFDYYTTTQAGRDYLVSLTGSLQLTPQQFEYLKAFRERELSEDPNGDISLPWDRPIIDDLLRLGLLQNVGGFRRTSPAGKEYLSMHTLLVSPNLSPVEHDPWRINKTGDNLWKLHYAHWNVNPNAGIVVATIRGKFHDRGNAYYEATYFGGRSTYPTSMSFDEVVKAVKQRILQNSSTDSDKTTNNEKPPC